MEFTVSMHIIDNPKTKLIGIANVVFESQFKVNGVKLFAGKEAGTTFIGLPSYKRVDPKENTTEYVPIVTLSKTLQNRLAKAMGTMHGQNMQSHSSNPDHTGKSDKALEIIQAAGKMPEAERQDLPSLPKLEYLVKNVAFFSDEANRPTLKGFANLEIRDGDEETITVNSITIRQRTNENNEKSLWVSMPREEVYPKNKETEITFRDQCHPLTRDLRKQVDALILDAYKERAVSEVEWLNELEAEAKAAAMGQGAAAVNGQEAETPAESARRKTREAVAREAAEASREGNGIEMADVISEHEDDIEFAG